MTELNENELNEVSGGTTGKCFPYTIVFGDTLSEIAVRFHTKVAILQKLNNIHDPDKIKAGHTILIPRD